MTLRVVRAFLWMRAKVFMHAFRPGSGRDTLEQTSRALSKLLPIIVLVLLLPTGVLLAILAFVGGQMMGDQENAFIGVAMVVGRAGLMLITIAVILGPLVRSARGASSGLMRLLLLPVRRRTLHLSEVLSGFADPWLALIVAPLILLAVGIGVGGAPLAALWSLAAAVAVLAVLALIASSCGFLMALVFRNRRRAEWVTLVTMSLLGASGLLIAVGGQKVEDRQERRAAARRARQAEVEGDRNISQRLDEALPAWTGAMPTELYFGTVSRSLDRPAWDAALPLGGLLLWGGALYLISVSSYRRLLESPENSGGRRGKRSVPRVSRIIGFGPDVSAVALTQLRSGLRTVRGKMSVYTNFIMLGLSYLLVFHSLGIREVNLPSGVSPGMAIAMAGYLLSQLSLQPILFNQFAIDKAGLSLLWLAPISTRALTRGKLLANALLIGLSTLLCLLVGVALDPHGHPLLWLTLLPVWLSSYLILGPLATWLSAVLPKTADLNRMGRPGNPHGVAGFVGVVLTPLVSLPALGLAALGLVIFGPFAALAASLVWTAMAGLISIPLQRAAEAAVARRAENLLLVAAGR